MPKKKKKKKSLLLNFVKKQSYHTVFNLAYFLILLFM